MSYVRVLLLLATTVAIANGAGLKEEFTWTRLDYVWPHSSRFGGYKIHRPVHADDIAFSGDVSSPTRKSTTEATHSGGGGDGIRNIEYIYENNIPMGANRWNDKLFITVPRRRVGVPATLNYVSMSSKERHNVPLNPYPNWEVNQLDSPLDQRLVSVYRVAIDACDRLWLIDIGIIEIPGNRTDIQPHSIVVMDLKTDKIIHRYQLKDSDLRPATILAFISVDVTKGTCNSAYAYLPDLAGYGLIVYSLKDNNSWRVNHNYFFLEPLAGDFTIGGQTFQWNDGVFSVALSDIKSDDYRDVYFHSMAGTNLYRVSTRILRNETAATRSYHYDDFVNLGDRGAQSQTSASDLHKSSGVLFLSLVNRNALGCWNTNKAFSPNNFDIVQMDSTKMIYPCDLKVYQNDVMVLTNNMPIFLYSRLNYDETNFRVWMNSVQGAIASTKCEAGRRPVRRPGYSSN